MVLLFEGLLAITAGAGSSSHEIMEESVPQLSRALKSGSDACKISVCPVLNCRYAFLGSLWNVHVFAAYFF